MLLRHPAINNPPYNNTAFWEGSRRTHGAGGSGRGRGWGGGWGGVSGYLTCQRRGQRSRMVESNVSAAHIFAHLASLDLLLIPRLTSCCSHDNCDCESSRRGAIISI